MLLAAYDAQLRGVLPDRLPKGVQVERDGPLLRYLGFGWGGFVDYRDLGGLEGSELDELIARQVRVFADRGERFEWKLHAHDLPTDLAERLYAAGFVPEDVETVVIAPVAVVATEPRLPEGVTLREVSERADLDRVDSARNEHVPGQVGAPRSRRPRGGTSRRPGCPRDRRRGGRGNRRLRRLGAFCAGNGLRPLCGVVRPYQPGAGAACIARSSRTARTSPQSAGSGISSVDASDDSRPILERLGFVAVTTTTPFVWSPPTKGGKTGASAQ